MKYEDERGAIDAVADFLKKKGYEVKTFENMDGTYTACAYVENEDGEIEKHFVCFDVA